MSLRFFHISLKRSAIHVPDIDIRLLAKKKEKENVKRTSCTVDNRKKKREKREDSQMGGFCVEREGRLISKKKSIVPESAIVFGVKPKLHDIAIADSNLFFFTRIVSFILYFIRVRLVALQC